MKIIHTSDWHLGHVLYNYDRTAEFEYMIDSLADIVEREKPDALLISGDLFHCSSPSATAQKSFVEGLLKIRNAHRDTTIIATAGNHDSPSRIDTNTALWAELGVTVLGSLVRNAEGEIDAERHIVDLGEGRGLVVALPYASLRLLDMEHVRTVVGKARQKAGDEVPVVVMAHLTVEGSNTEGHDDGIGGIDYVKIDEFGSDYDYLALGHIHCPQDIKGSEGKARYCGTPVAISFDENYPHGVSIVEVKAGEKPAVRVENIEPLVRLKTIPQKPAPLDEAIAELKKLPDDDKCYVRLNVLVEDYLPSDCQVTAAEAVRDKAARFCYVLPTREKAEKDERQVPRLNIHEFKEMSPLDIAKSFYASQYNKDMDSESIELLKEIISEIEQAE